MKPTIEALVIAALKWWEEHQYDVTGDYGGYNVYDRTPEWVVLAQQYKKDNPQDF